MPGLEPAPVVAVHLFAEDPIGAPEPRVVQETGSRKQVVAHQRQFLRLWGRLLAATPRADLHRCQNTASSLQIEGLRSHVDRTPVGGKDIGQSHRHVLPLHQRLQILVGRRIAVVDAGFGHLPACEGGQPQESHSTVEESRPARHAVDAVLLYEHASRDRPGRLDLLVRHQAAIDRSRAKPPGQGPIGRTQAVHPAVGRAKQDHPPVDRWRRIDPCTAGETPGRLARRRVQRVQRMAFDGGHKHLACGHDHTTEFPIQVSLPLLFQVNRHRGPGRAAACSIAAIGRPSSVVV